MNIEITKRLNAACSKWVGTPYVAGQSVPGPQGGTDCVRVCDLILQEALGLCLDPLPRYAQDAAFHNKEVVAEMQRHLFRRFDLRNIDLDEPIEPLDLIICSQLTGTGSATTDGHHIILCQSKNQCIDAWPGIGVRRVGMGVLTSGFTIHKVWRPNKR